VQKAEYIVTLPLRAHHVLSYIFTCALLQKLRSPTLPSHIVDTAPPTTVIYVACCLLPAVSCLLSALCCLLPDVCSLLSAACYFLLAISSRLLMATPFLYAGATLYHVGWARADAVYSTEAMHSISLANAAACLWHDSHECYGVEYSMSTCCATSACTHRAE
jgi:hypothetical protein